MTNVSVFYHTERYIETFDSYLKPPEHYIVASFHQSQNESAEVSEYYEEHVDIW